jgi:hypothetical protein
MTKSSQGKKNKKGKVLPAISYMHIQAYYSYATCGNSGDKGDTAESYCKYNTLNWDGPLLGNIKCPCVGFYDRSGTVKLTVKGQTINYPGMTGGECMKWDKPRHPDCITGGDVPSWCGSKWCWVDPDNCDLPDSPPQLFTRNGKVYQNGKALYWSYATCGDKDIWNGAPAMLQVGVNSQDHAQDDMKQAASTGDPSCACIGVDVPGETQIWDGTDKSTSKTLPYSYGSTCEFGCCYFDPCTCMLAMTKRSQ